MKGHLKLITPPSIEPVTAAEVKLHSHISGSVEDSLIEMWISSARQAAENYQNRAYISQTWELSFDRYPNTPILLPRSPIQLVHSIKTYDYLNAETILYEELYNPITTTEEDGTEPSTNSNFLIDVDNEPGRICLAYGVWWPSTNLREMNSVKIQYHAGYGNKAEDVPGLVKDAIILFCTHKNENRSSEDDTIPKQFFDLLRPDRMII